MAREDDVGFTFDPKPFLAGLDKIGGGLSKIEQATKKAGEKMGAAMTWALLKAQALGAAIKGAFTSIAAHIPELGQTFGMASDIFLKNFLWPLRQALGPYLQKLLDWVRDNRSQFVQWGAVVANAFRVGVVLAKGLWDILASLWDRVLKPIINAIFGTNGIGGGVTLLLGKLAVVATFLTGMFDKIFSSDSFKGILADITSIVTQVSNFVRGLFEANVNGDKIQNVFKTIGEVLGTITIDAIKLVKDFLSGFTNSDLKNAATPLQAIANAIKMLMDQVDGLVKSPGFQNFVTWLGAAFGDLTQGLLVTFSVAAQGLSDTLTLITIGLKSVFALMSGDKTFDAAKDYADANLKSVGNWAKIIQSFKTLGKDVSGLEGFGTPTNEGEANRLSKLAKGQAGKPATVPATTLPGPTFGQTINVGGVKIDLKFAEQVAGLSDDQARKMAGDMKEPLEKFLIDYLRDKQTYTGKNNTSTVRQ